MQVVFRTDSSLQIGTGHAMRCLTLAERFKDDGAQVFFVCRDLPGNMVGFIKNKGFLVVTLQAPNRSSGFICAEDNVVHAEWLGVSWQQDAEETRLVLESQSETIDWLIVDHYALDHRWEKNMRSLVQHIMVIDDLADRSHDCDLLLDQNLGRDKSHYQHLVPQNCTVLTGPHYALLRPEFAALRNYSLQRRINPQLKHLLISMGGIDQINATGQVLEAIKACALPDDLRITVVMGANAPWLTQVETLAEQLPQPVEVKVNVQNMAQLMADSDLAIGAAGSTSWERCCLGVPSIIFVLAENQQVIANSLQSAGAAKVFPVNGDVKSLGKIIEKIVGNFDECARMSAAAALITDGNGTNKVAAKLQAITQI
ncbi:MAG: UDP-2,4-diacetamido-2,4,6-trideoxy-beta-L-altropyranose hydrolase [Candidatus Electrothrix sp. AW1]|nr:UDP-2,4-diacetamido-2,4,6-trideoxy-beta-L-altropyranose hydrolase [Candidatus Electrothrix sp. AX1]MCI5182294.1 UDP-2,4-diacetamido-2,4,6-trideoxy-beta-L-altropyranose hydrolase [Candidatus Electrothrix gigas]